MNFQDFFLKFLLAKSQPPEDIKPPVATGYELRVIVWETRKVALKDKDGKSSDIFIVGYPEGVEPQPTGNFSNIFRQKAIIFFLIFLIFLGIFWFF